jgi:hypothetical protein
MNEKQVEKYLHNEVGKLGGTTRKWTSPGRVGVPDRIVIIPGGIIIFVEVKTDKGKVSAPQEREIQRLTDLGCTARVVYGREGVDVFINSVRHNLI